MSEEIFEIITDSFSFAIAWAVLLATIMLMVINLASNKKTKPENKADIKEQEIQQHEKS